MIFVLRLRGNVFGQHKNSRCLEIIVVFTLIIFCSDLVWYSILKNSPSLFSICLIICTVKLKKLIWWHKLLIPFRSLVHIFLKPPIFVRMENELNKVINRNKQEHRWIYERRRNLRFQGLSYRLQCFSDANGVILKFDWIWTKKKIRITPSIISTY